MAAIAARPARLSDVSQHAAAKLHPSLRAALLRPTETDRWHGGRQSRRPCIVRAADSATTVERRGRRVGPGVKKGGQKQTPLPEPADYQQTLRRSFVIGGVGAHTGEFAVVCVRPALAGEGRYFVRVPRGTNSSLWQPEEPHVATEGELEGNPPVDAGQEAMRTRLFFDYLRATDAGEFKGGFAEWLEAEHGSGDDPFTAAEEALPAEQASPRTEREGEYLPAALAAADPDSGPWLTTLGRPPAEEEGWEAEEEERRRRGAGGGGGGGADAWGLQVQGVEHLLAALEASGVDNARVEIEGGPEVPVVDGSAQGWAVEIIKAGLAEAGPERTARHVPAPQEESTTRDDADPGAFITFVPGPETRVTVGVNASATAPVIGKQWISWSPDSPATDGYFQFELAPARTHYESVEQVQSLLEQGLLRGGPEMVSLIGAGEEWHDWTQELRFPGSEAARHAAVDLLGDLALLARPGGRGLPRGHTLAYRPNHALNRKYAARLAAQLSEWMDD